MKMNTSFACIAIALTLSMAWAPMSNVEAGKPIDVAPGEVLLTGDLIAEHPDGGPMETFDVELKSGKETIVSIVVRHFEFTALFAQRVDFYGGKYGDNPPDGATCFAGSAPVSGMYRLFQDGSAEFSTYPEFFTADGNELQKYHFFLTGRHNVQSLEGFPVAGPVSENNGNLVILDFDRAEITTEGRGQNRRRSCTGVFDDIAATATFQR
jgi:hypothetical protein